jgi:rod shape-determining protein MreD
MPYLAPAHPEIQRPVSTSLIVLSVLFALFLNGLPWEGLADAAPGLRGRGDVVLVHAQAAARRHRTVWAVSILADVADASLFGQHALAYRSLAA